jgi:hypothetical protein
MFPTIKGQRFTHQKGTKQEHRGLIVHSFAVSSSDKLYATLSELLKENPINESIAVHIEGLGSASIIDCTAE